MRAKRYKDLTGMVFSRLTVISPVGQTSNGGMIWRCMCECGMETDVRSSNLVQGVSTSCGCKRSEVMSIRAKVRNITRNRRKSRRWNSTPYDDVQEFLNS